MSFKDELRQASLEIFGADATSVFDYKKMDSNYLKHVLDRPFNRATKHIEDLKKQYPDFGSFKQALIQDIASRSESGYTSKFADTILQAALWMKIFTYEEYVQVRRHLFGMDKVDDEMKKQYLEIEKQNIQNQDPWADL